MDAFGRAIDYLRVSVTDQCDLRCQYCRPTTLPLARRLDHILSAADFVAIVQAAATLGIRKVRLTGGEPLLRRDILDLVRGLSAIPGIEDLSLTTNALHLAGLAADLATAGLTRVNISLDSLQADRFTSIAGAAGLERVLQGIAAAQTAGLSPLKVNMVVMRGVNDDEIGDFAARTIDSDWHVRFIEVMPFSGGSNSLLVPAKEILARLPNLVPDASVLGHGPARMYRLPGARGTVAVISPVSEHFCGGCNRLRLTADGKLRPCLLNEGEVDLLPALRTTRDPDKLAALIQQAVANKPARHHLSEGISPHDRTMAQIGG